MVVPALLRSTSSDRANFDSFRERSTTVIGTALGRGTCSDCHSFRERNTAVSISDCSDYDSLREMSLQWLW